ncbi:MAG: hypothetical protein GYA24_15540 [Candidatus Lokiarchaeota archaeon]|nr:hypothetical protein [Candidatus Lokiarchaeota archaeon]
MATDQEQHMEINAQFFDRISFVQSVFDYAKVDAKIYLNGPITIPVACSEVVRKKAEEMGIETTEVGIVFIIEKPDDFLVAMEKFRNLFYKTSDLAGRVPGDLGAGNGKDTGNKITDWFKGLIDRFKST